jgi:hypothetical protein
MNILFLDDTTQEKETFVGIGGVIFHDTCISSLCQLFDATKEEHGIPSNEEIKWSPKRDSWIYNNLKGHRRDSAYSAFLDLVRVCSGTTMVAVIRKDVTSFDTAGAKWQCIQFISERFQFFLQSQEDRNGIIIKDFPGSGTEEKKLLSNYYELRRKGTRYVKKLSNIIMNLLTTESQWHAGLQIGDLIVGVTTAMCTAHTDYAERLWQMVKERLYRSESGNIIGCGLKIFPQESAEDVYARLFPEHFEKDYREYIEEMRLLYSQVMSEDELDINFPRL